MRTRDLALAFAFQALILAAAPAAAQYKWIAPNGAVTYSDQPPPPGTNGHVLGAKPSARGDEGGVPAALRDATTKYPVVLYTTTDCAPCQQARSHLSKRGVPFSERTVSSSTDAEQFRKAGFAENSFPAIAVGRERSVGFEVGDWNRLLDAAGYPKTSVLPPSFKHTPAKALAEADRTGGNPADAGSGERAAADGPRARARPAPLPRAEAPANNPNAVRF
jgi:glutaredoxin